MKLGINIQKLLQQTLIAISAIGGVLFTTEVAIPYYTTIEKFAIINGGSSILDGFFILLEAVIASLLLMGVFFLFIWIIELLVSNNSPLNKDV